MTFQPLLTSMNPINHHQDTDSKQQLDRNVPRIPLPKVAMPSFATCNLSLPPLPSGVAADSHSKGPLALNRNGRTLELSHSESPATVDVKVESTDTVIARRTRSRSRSRGASNTKSKSKSKSVSVSVTSVPIPGSLSISAPKPSSRSVSGSLSAVVSPSGSYSKNAFNHNLKVKQEHLKEETVLDIAFDCCYIFNMRCPYNECCELFDDMSAYQSHHIQHHQERDSNGRLIQTKEAKWRCPECGKVSASWYNYAAHVTMHKDSCDAPWICKLPPINKKKYIQWTDGTFICGKRCSTKHNLIKHLKALHTDHRIIDLSQSVKAQSTSVPAGYRSRSQSQSLSAATASHGNDAGNRRRHKKRPRFNMKPGSASPSFRDESQDTSNSLNQPPRKRQRTKLRNPASSLPPNDSGLSVPKSSASPALQQQGDFVSLLLEAAQLIEGEDTHDANSPLPANQTVDYIQNANELDCDS